MGGRRECQIVAIPDWAGVEWEIIATDTPPRLWCTLLWAYLKPQRAIKVAKDLKINFVIVTLIALSGQ